MNKFKFLYDLEEPIEEKIRTIAQKIYSAQDIQISETAQNKIDILKRQVFSFSYLIILIYEFQYYLTKNFEYFLGI
jgi:formyltetrahydrofolate synthetase